MRITGGIARGICLKAGNSLRPAMDRVREALFSHLGASIKDATFLDLFAGTGAYGLEALSRGASGGMFVEKVPRNAACIQDNLACVIKSMGIKTSPCQILIADVFKKCSRLPNRFDIIFIDPPYQITTLRANEIFSLVRDCLKSIQTSRVIFEMPAQFSPEPSGWRIEHCLGKSKARNELKIIIYSREKEEISQN
jgi:16S rRNA (guanine966-N2)-methyltransferase